MRDPHAHVKSLIQRDYVPHLDGTATCKRCGCMVKAGLNEDWTNMHDLWHESSPLSKGDSAS